MIIRYVKILIPLVVSAASLAAQIPQSAPAENYAVLAVKMQSDGKKMYVVGSYCTDMQNRTYKRLFESSEVQGPWSFDGTVKHGSGIGMAMLTVEAYGWPRAYEDNRTYYLGTQHPFGSKSLGGPGTTQVPESNPIGTGDATQTLRCSFGYDGMTPIVTITDRLNPPHGKDTLYPGALDSDDHTEKGKLLLAVRMSKAMFDQGRIISLDFTSSGGAFTGIAGGSVQGVYVLELSNAGLDLKAADGTVKLHIPL